MTTVVRKLKLFSVEFSVEFVGKYLFNLLLSLDQLLNVILLGDPDDSLSGRCGRAVLSGRPKFWVTPLMHVMDFLFLTLAGEENHCLSSVEPEELMKKELWRWSK